MKNLTHKLFPFGTRKDADTTVDLDDHRYVRIGYLVIAGGLGSFLVWAALAPLDQGVPGQGVVTVINQRKVVQHPVGGLIDEVLIKEGDKVKAGQLIARLNSADSTAQAETVRAQYRAAKAEEERLLAELSGKKSLTTQTSDPRMSEAMGQQAAVLSARREVLTNDLAAMRASLHGLEQQASGFRTLQYTRRQQSELAKQQLAGVRELTEAGYYPKNRLLELERTAAEHDAKAEETKVELARLEASIAEARHRLQQREQSYRQESETRLAELQQELLGLQARMDAADFAEKGRMVVSPADGLAVGLNFHGKGEVVPPGGRIVDIVPEKEQLIIEAKFAPDMADELRSGLKVNIQFSGLNRIDLPTIDGTVMTVSADRLIDEATHAPYFLARVQLTNQGLATLSEHGIAIQPGMPAEVMVKTGERTMFSYLIAPIRERMEWAFIEK